MSDHKDDKALDEYLKGDSDLSRRYRDGKQAGPPEHLDAAIIKAARSAVTGKPRSHTRSWYVPLSLAAVVVIGVSVVFRLYQYQGQQLLSEPAQDLILDKKSDRDVSGKDYSRGIAEPPAAPAPETYQVQPEMDDVQEELKQQEFNEVPALKSMEKPAAARSMKQVEKAVAVPQARKQREMSPEAILPSVDELSGMESHAAGDETGEMRAPMEAGRPSDTMTREGRVISETGWLAHVRKLWEAGEKDEAVASLKQFLTTYPQYSHDEIIKQLPSDFDPAKYISGFEIK